MIYQAVYQKIDMFKKNQMLQIKKVMNLNRK